jgi:hypothetical protein
VTKYGVRDLVYIGVFAACWGALEVTLGALLHALRVPFLGALMAGAGMAIGLVGRLYVPKRGSIVAIALVTAVLKLFSIGGDVLSPMIAIVIEGALAELCVGLIGASRSGFLLAGAVATLWSLAHSFIRIWMIGGAGLFAAYRTLVDRGAKTLGMAAGATTVVLLALVGVHLAIGLVGGWSAWRIGTGLSRRGRQWTRTA